MELLKIMSWKNLNKRFSIKTVFIQLIVTLILIICIDIIANLFIERVGHKEFRLQQPEPYVNANYFSKKLISSPKINRPQPKQKTAVLQTYLVMRIVKI